ncbi:B-lymphocyte antigen CD20-like isoform X3 [Oncorhynchus nerka]|uniref:B-lymphocyte antigen CD20-like isoform X3 n=1 Tax=Oncorhynchus nerka TaxID=8023 RepID=UPI0031B88ABD
MSSSQTTTTNGAVVITHVYPYENGMGVAGVASAPHCLGQTVSSVLGSFRAGHPKALGTIQIMIGLIMLLTGIVMTAGPQVDNIGVLSGIFVWGSIIYVVAGSLTVAADNKLNKCLVRSQGISGVLAVFSLLEFIVSICVSSFACRAVCLCCRSTPEHERKMHSTSQKFGHTDPFQQVFIIGNQVSGPHGSMTPSNAPYPPQINYETGNYTKGPEGDGMGTGFQQNHLPPQYTAVIP